MASDLTTQLLSALNETISLLRQSRETHWASWLERDRDRITDGDFYGVEHLLQAFGGMGSFSDCLLHDPSKSAQLHSLRSKLYESASALRRARDRREAI